MRGEVSVQVGDIDKLDLSGATFDRIFSVNCIYFWRETDATLDKLAAALAPSGKLVLAFRPDGEDVPARFRDPTYRFPRLDAIRVTLERRGLIVEAVASKVAQGIVLLFATRS